MFFSIICIFHFKKIWHTVPTDRFPLYMSIICIFLSSLKNLGVNIDKEINEDNKNENKMRIMVWAWFVGKFGKWFGLLRFVKLSNGHDFSQFLCQYCQTHCWAFYHFPHFKDVTYHVVGTLKLHHGWFFKIRSYSLWKACN